MQKKTDEFSMDRVMQLAKSPAGQQLLAMLQQKDPQALQQAAKQASQGDYKTAGQTLSAVLSSPEAQKLMKELGR